MNTNPPPPKLPPNPTHADIDAFVNSAQSDVLKNTLSSISPGYNGLYHPSDEYLKEQIEKKLNINGGRRRSKKRPTARRLRRRSSKSSKARKSRKARTTRRR